MGRYGLHCDHGDRSVDEQLAGRGVWRTVSVDAYPDMKFKGKVKSIGDSATSEFALLPTPNPSGNFTKITQRLPVRVKIDQQGRKFRPRYDGDNKDRRFLL